jgi:hypothetical protein
MNKKGALAYKDTGKEETKESIFDRREELVDILRRGPAKAQPPEAEPPANWRLKSIRRAVLWLKDYSLSGVWRLLQRYQLNLRTAQVQQYSPDPDYDQKEAHLLACLRKTAQNPEKRLFLFLDELGYYCWPEATKVWGQAAPSVPPLADRQQAKQQQWRLIGVLNALTGQVDYLDNYIVGRAKVIEMYHLIAHRYAGFDHIFVAQDNWSIHKHPDVCQALQSLPQIEPVWLPTYSPWLNPIEKLWRWLRQDVLKMHRLAAHWSVLRQKVNAFLDQFSAGSQQLLRYVGLAGDGKLAHAIRST